MEFKQNLPNLYSYIKEDGTGSLHACISPTASEVYIRITKDFDDLSRASLTIPLTPESATALRNYLTVILEQ